MRQYGYKMIRKNGILHSSLFVGIIGVLAGGAAFGAVRIGNMSRAEAYRQLNAQRAAAEQQAFQQQQVIQNQNVQQSEVVEENTDDNAKNLESCSAIYPGGEFAWDKPTAGVGAGGASTCVATVELRALTQSSASIMNPNAPQYVVVARANVAAGSAIMCNISSFPESSYTNEVQNVIFPADAEPTTQDVIEVLNQEQKQNAGLKIAAATLVGAIGGNIAGKNDIGKDSLMGTDKGKMQGTLIGALGGAAVGAGSVYTGKVAGDMILSTGVNAAAGGVVGNIMATGETVLRVEKCAGGRDCLWGVVTTGESLKYNSDNKLCETDTSGSLKNCKDSYLDLNDGRTVITCDNGTCSQDRLESITLYDDTYVDGLKDLRQDLQKIIDKRQNGVVFYLEHTQSGDEMKPGVGGVQSHTYGRIKLAMRPKNKRPALIQDNIKDKMFGMTRSDWIEWKKNAKSDLKIYGRGADGEPSGEIEGATLANFSPIYIDAEDGGIIDLDNKARLKSTMIGAGVGGAAGAFTAYQGAQNDIDERWVAAVREYKDSLQKFYCATGSRFLSYYNDPVIIPNMNE